MKKTIILTVFIFSLIFLISCEKQDYKRIVVEENIGLERETNVGPSIFGQVHLDLDITECFYPTFYYEGEIYGYLKKNHGNDFIARKYLYKLDLNNKLTETPKIFIDFKPGLNKVGLMENKAYMIDYNIRSKPTPIHELSRIINELRESEKENQYDISYVSGSNRYIVVNEISSSGEIRNVYLYDLVEQRFYKNKTHRYGDICYVFELRSLIWIDQKDFKIYKLQVEDDYYTLEEYIDLGIDEDISRVRGVMKNGYELMLFHDVRLGNKENWNLMRTSAVTSYNFARKQHVNLFSKSIPEYSYIEYIGSGIFIEDSFDLFNGYIELTKRSIYHYNYTKPILVYDEEFQEKSQQFYPEINVLVDGVGYEIFSTREIKKIIGGIPVTKDVIYQRVKLFRSK